jgi:ATP-binding cassette subfamily F protein 3
MRYLSLLINLRVGGNLMRFLRFCVVGLSGLFVNLLLHFVCTELLQIHYLIGAVMATLGSTIWNFLLAEYALSIALQDFSGAIVLLSHDRHLIKSTADELWLVRDGQVTPYDGDLADYARWLRRNQAEAPLAPHEGAAAPANKVAAAPPPPRRRLSYSQQRELERLPAEIERLEHEQQVLHARLADPEVYQRSGEHIASLRSELDRVDAALAAAFTRWDVLEDERERA